MVLSRVVTITQKTYNCIICRARRCSGSSGRMPLHKQTSRNQNQSYQIIFVICMKLFGDHTQQNKQQERCSAGEWDRLLRRHGASQRHRWQMQKNAETGDAQDGWTDRVGTRPYHIHWLIHRPAGSTAEQSSGVLAANNKTLASKILI